jgi:hypothetical protein
VRTDIFNILRSRKAVKQETKSSLVLLEVKREENYDEEGEEEGLEAGFLEELQLIADDENDNDDREEGEDDEQDNEERLDEEYEEELENETEVEDTKPKRNSPQKKGKKLCNMSANTQNNLFILLNRQRPGLTQSCTVSGL